MHINKAALDVDAYVKQELRGLNYGINFGYKF